MNLPDQPPARSNDLYTAGSARDLPRTADGELDYKAFEELFGKKAGGANAGEKTGHGVGKWVAVDVQPPLPAWGTADARPVIALLDSGVRQHELLPSDGDSFVLEPTGWEPLLQIESMLPAEDGGTPLGSHAGHGTFIAGIIRQVAPTAQVLSMTVMDDLGRVNEENVTCALTWLTQYEGRVDAVLMAFGREVHDGDDMTDSAKRLKAAIDTLVEGRPQLQVVISAGNGEGSDKPVFPASYAPGAGGRVTSIGSGPCSAAPEHHSSTGNWVQDWALGQDVVSLMPTDLRDQDKKFSTGWAKWSGTSFSAARYAAGKVVE